MKLPSGFHKSDIVSKKDIISDGGGRKEPINSHGGWRPGSGRKKILENAGNWKAYLDRETHDYFIFLGNGNFSAGIRKAREILEERSNNHGHKKTSP